MHFKHQTVWGADLMRQHIKKSRRGLGLLDVILSLAILVLVIGSIKDYVDVQNLRRAERAEAHNLAQARAILGAYVENQALNLTATLAINGAQQVSVADLTSIGLNLDPTLLTGIEGRTIDLWVVHEADNVLTYFARASGALDTPHYPRPDPALGRLGSLTQEDPTRIRGIGVNWLVTGRTGFTPSLDDTFALGQIDIDADIMPYLHRANVTAPGGTPLSQMEADLDLGGNNIINAGNVTLSGNLSTTGTIDATTSTLTGVLNADSFSIVDDLTVGADLTAGALSGAGDITVTGDVSVSGTLTAGQAVINGTGTFQTLTAAGALNVNGTTTITGTLAADDLNIGTTLNVGGTLTSDNIVGSSMSVAGTLTSTNGTFNSITTGSCTGC